MKKTISYAIYGLFILFLTIVTRAVVLISLGMSLFMAADAPPGDISISEKLMYSIGVPFFYYVLITALFILYKTIITKMNISLNEKKVTIFNGILAIGFMIYLTYYVFIF